MSQAEDLSAPSKRPQEDPFHPPLKTARSLPSRTPDDLSMNIQPNVTWTSPVLSADVCASSCGLRLWYNPRFASLSTHPCQPPPPLPPPCSTSRPSHPFVLLRPAAVTCATPLYTLPNACFYPGMLSSKALAAEQPCPSQRERTMPLRQWLLKNRHHPYPSKEDKLLLAMETQMRVDQVSMWFANTRRQIRKVGMKVWSGGRCDTPIPQRIGNGAVCLSDREGASEEDVESASTGRSENDSAALSDRSLSSVRLNSLA